MALLDRFFGPAHRRAAAAAASAESAGRHAEAWSLLEEAERSAPEAERGELAARRAALGTVLLRRNVVDAEQLAAAGDLDGAVDRAELAARFAASEQERAEVAALRDRFVEARLSAKAASGATPQGPALLDFAVILGALPDEIADRYDALGTAARDAICHARTLASDESLRLLDAADDGGDALVLSFERGLVLRARGREAEAADALARAAKHAGSWNDVRLAAAEALWTADRLAEAEEALQEAIDLDDNDVAVWVAVTTHALLSDDAEAGLEAVDEALTRWPSDLNLRTLRGQLLAMAGREAEAIALWDEIVAQTWSFDADSGQLEFHGESTWLLALALARRGERLERALELMNALLAAVGGETRDAIELDRAWVLTRLGRDADARDVVERVRHGLAPARLAARAWAAELLGDAAARDALVAEMTPAQLRRWERLRRERSVAT
jgi:tetratricopeptide (TPR) repeat protein